jgi:hypothetical protein
MCLSKVITVVHIIFSATDGKKMYFINLLCILHPSGLLKYITIPLLSLRALRVKRFLGLRTLMFLRGFPLIVLIPWVQ